MRAVLVLLLLTACSSQAQRPAPPASDMELTIATLNILNQTSDWPARRPWLEVGLQQIAPDIVALQEVMIAPQGTDQARWIEQALAMEVAFQPMVVYPGEIRFGLAVASRFPILASHCQPLPSPADDPRIVQQVVVESPLGPLHVYNTHLSWKPADGELRRQQTLALAEYIRQTNGYLPPVLLGDFNAPPDSVEILTLTSSPPGAGAPFVDAWRTVHGYVHAPTWNRENPLTLVGDAPSRRIDYIFLGRNRRRLKALPLTAELFCDRPGADGTWPTDHAGVVSRVRFRMR